jgi:ADP-heptose:LPS heptosyltransferase
MAPHLDRANVRLFSLQMGAAADQMADAGIAVTDLREAIGDMADTAALVRHLDLVITVDTAVAHLGGALGWPTWVLLPFAPDWRWLTDRADSPWYPTVRLFRQRRPGDWGEVMERVGMELSKLADDRERRRAHV